MTTKPPKHRHLTKPPLSPSPPLLSLNPSNNLEMNTITMRRVSRQELTTETTLICTVEKSTKMMTTMSTSTLATVPPMLPIRRHTAMALLRLSHSRDPMQRRTGKFFFPYFPLLPFQPCIFFSHRTCMLDRYCVVACVSRHRPCARKMPMQLSYDGHYCISALLDKKAKDSRSRGFVGQVARWAI